MIKLYVFVMCLCWPVLAYAGGIECVELVRVVDGDTIVVNIAHWPAIVGSQIGVRVAGCDTPELWDKRFGMRSKAIEAKQFVCKILEKARVIELHNIRRGKSFRLVADVYADGLNLSHSLITSGRAIPYNGVRKR